MNYEPGPLAGAGQGRQAAIERLGRSGASPNARTVADDLRSLGYQYIPEAHQGGSPENYLRAIDSRRGTAAVAYLTPTYLELTPFALQIVPGLASLPGAERRDSGGEVLSHQHRQASPGRSQAIHQDS
jgi:hypothetical protein